MQFIQTKFQPYLFTRVIAFLKQSWKIAIWLVIAGVLMTSLIALGRNWSYSLLLKVASFTCLIWLFLWLGNAFLSSWIDAKISWQEKPGLRLIAGILAMLVYTISLVYAIVFFYRWVFDFMVSEDMRGFLYSSVIITTIISMFMTSRSFLMNWRQSAIDTEAMKRESINAKYESLKNQVNPHFLFNSLNALTNLVYEDQDKAARFIKQLSEVYRYVLDNRDRETVSLTDEMKFVNSYLYLQQIRFGNGLKVEISLNQTKGQLPPLALQVLVENAIKHNIISEDSPLTIRINTNEDRIVVENSLQRKSIIQEESSGLGLKNIISRYELLTDGKVIVSEADGVFKVTLPLLFLSHDSPGN